MPKYLHFFAILSFFARFLNSKIVPLWRIYPPFTMRQMLLAIFSALYLGASAQITITVAAFPKAGDTLKIAVDNNPAAALDPATPPGGNQTWDLSGLKAAQTNELIYRPISAGTHAAGYPGADMVVIGNNGEIYYNATGSKWENMGFAGTQAQFFNLAVAAKYRSALVERHAPLTFFDVFQQETNLALPFSAKNLPDSLFAAAPIKPDSVRLRFNLKRTELADAWGTCKIPGGNYPVIRVRRTDLTTPGMDVKVGFFWLDVTQLLQAAGGQIGDLLATDTTVTYRFYNNTVKEEIAVATMSNDLTTVTNVSFKNNKIVSTEENISPKIANIQAYPNPAIENVRFDCTNLPNGPYTLKIYNIIGRVVWRQNYTMSGNQSIPLNLDKFNKGTYLYSLIDGKGHAVGTKRLVILKP